MLKQLKGKENKGTDEMFCPDLGGNYPSVYSGEKKLSHLPRICASLHINLYLNKIKFLKKI